MKQQIIESRTFDGFDAKALDTQSKSAKAIFDAIDNQDGLVQFLSGYEPNKEILVWLTDVESFTQSHSDSLLELGWKVTEVFTDTTKKQFIKLAQETVKLEQDVFVSPKNKYRVAENGSPLYSALNRYGQPHFKFSNKPFNAFFYKSDHETKVNAIEVSNQ